MSIEFRKGANRLRDCWLKSKSNEILNNWIRHPVMTPRPPLYLNCRVLFEWHFYLTIRIDRFNNNWDKILIFEMV